MVNVGRRRWQWRRLEALERLSERAAESAGFLMAYGWRFCWLTRWGSGAVLQDPATGHMWKCGSDGVWSPTGARA